jgi:hypothetical protein
VETKRRGQTFQAVVNGTLSSQAPNLRPFVPLPLQRPKLPPQLDSPRYSKISSTPYDGVNAIGTTSSSIPFSKPSQNTFSPGPAQASTQISQPPAVVPGGEQIKAPIPQRAKISPVLNLQPPPASTSMPIPAPPDSDNISAPPAIPPKIQFSSSFQFNLPLSSTQSPGPAPKTNKAPSSIVVTAPTPPAKELPDSTKRDGWRQTLFEQQEKLLRAELTRQEHERALKLKVEEKKHRQSREVGRQLIAERQLLREKETEALQKERDATRINEERERAIREKKKAEREKAIQFYSAEIVNAIVREHILEVNATMLAIAFHRKNLLGRVVRLLKKICTRSVRRKELYLEQKVRTRLQKSLLTRALSELDNGTQTAIKRKTRRRSQRTPLLEPEEYLEDVLIKATAESKTLWKPLDLGTVLTPYLDSALSKAGLFEVEWNLLLLSVEDELNEETTWLRTKFGFVDRENHKRIPSQVASVSALWSPVMQYAGQLDHVGALIFIYEGSALVTKSGKPDTPSLLHEVIRQTSLQSRYKFPVLIINFDKTSANASDVRSFTSRLTYRLLES